MLPVQDSPRLTTVSGREPEAAIGALRVQLEILLREHGYRLNRVLPKDGTEAMEAPLPLESYTLATRPPAADWPGSIIFVSDALDGMELQWSDGTAWLNATASAPGGGYLPRDGSLPMTAPLPLATFTTAGRPAAASWTGGIIYVSDAAVGERFQGSDGSAWRPLGTVYSWG